MLGINYQTFMSYAYMGTEKISGGRVLQEFFLGGSKNWVKNRGEGPEKNGLGRVRGVSNSGFFSKFSRFFSFACPNLVYSLKLKPFNTMGSNFIVLFIEKGKY